MSPTIDPSKLKVTELREELQARGLDTKGNKPVLVKRLKKALEHEINKELPDTSVADTSTEDIDSSRTEEVNSKEAEAEPEPEPESVSEQKDAESSSQQKVDEPLDSTENVEASDANETTNGEEDTSKTESHENKQETQDNQGKEEELSSDKKEVKITDITVADDRKGEKRKRTDESTEDAQKKKVFKISEDEPEIDSSKVLLSWYDSDLHLIVDKQSFLSAKPIHDGVFGFSWAGARATHGVTSGKVCYEVKLTEEMPWVDFTNQRREKLEKAKERRGRGKQKQKSASQKSATEVKKEDDSGKSLKKESDGDKSPKKEDDSDKPQDEKMEVTESEPSAAEKSEDTKNENETGPTDDTKMDTTEQLPEEVEECSNLEEDAEKEPSESVEDSKIEPSETVEGDKKEDSEERKKESVDPPQPILTHLFRIGWSIQKTSLQLGEDNFSYGYESTGKFVSNKEFKDFAVSYKLGDVVGAYMDISAENVEMRFTVNGELQPEVISIPRSELPQENLVFFPHVLSRNYGYELNLGTKEEPWFPCPEDLKDYSFLQAVDEKVPGPIRPEKKEECEVLLMCGLPGSGKTHWVNEYVKTNTDKQITVIGASNLVERMTVHGKPLKSSYDGQWNILMEKVQRCLNRLNDIAAQRRRNYILDQTKNVLPSVQLRKLRAFEGFKRRAVVVVVGDEEFTKRQSLKEAAVGKDVHESTIMELKANMDLPTKGDWCDEIIYTDLKEDEAKAKVSQYNSEGKAAINQKKKIKDDKTRSYNRGSYNRGGFRDNRGPHRFERGSRGWGHLPPPGRNSRDRRPPPPPMSGGRDWMRNNRGPQRSINERDRNPRDSRPMNYNRNRGGGRPSNWQSGGGSGYGQGGWGGGHQGNWGYGNQGWGSNYQQQGNWNGNSQNPWKYGGSGNHQGYNQQGYNQQSYDQDWNNYYGHYPQNWSGQGQQSAGGSNQYAQWAQYAQQYAQRQNARYTNAASKK